MRDLLEYLEEADGSPGCDARYEARFRERGWPWLAGWYSSLLRSLVGLLGRDKLIDLVAARLDVEDTYSEVARLKREIEELRERCWILGGDGEFHPWEEADG